jgi:hypothetical protein
MRRTRRLPIVIWFVVAACAAVAVVIRVVGVPFSHARAVASGRAVMVPVQQFEQLHPGATHFISYLTGTHGTPTWNAVAGLYGRYELTMQVPVTLNACGTRSCRTGSPCSSSARSRA